jgi:hypothetical protein
MYINHQKKATSVMNTGEPINLPLLKTAVSAWAMMTKRTEWLTAIQLVGGHGSGQRNDFLPAAYNNIE